MIEQAKDSETPCPECGSLVRYYDADTGRHMVCTSLDCSWISPVVRSFWKEDQ